LNRLTKVFASITVILMSVFVGIATMSSAAPLSFPGELHGLARAMPEFSERPEKDRFEAMRPGPGPRDENTDRIKFEDITFSHGDVSWLPSLAERAGWPAGTHERLAEIVLRESGGCPNRKGGDVVDKSCVITGVSEWNHRSDTGLLQINGVNYNTKRNKWARVCLDLGICEQEPLLNPLTNLKAGYLLYQYSGWGPWDPCTWGPEFAHRCKKKD